jgi:hypothetical protein
VRPAGAKPWPGAAQPGLAGHGGQPLPAGVSRAWPAVARVRLGRGQDLSGRGWPGHGRGQPLPAGAWPAVVRVRHGSDCDKFNK